MTWMQMADGTRMQLHPGDLGRNSYRLRTLAHHCAQINRFTGAASRPYSVAEHSLFVADLARQRGHGPVAQLCALTHDLHEAIVGDVSSPMKHTLGATWATFERVHQRAMLRALGVRDFWLHGAMVRECDLIALATERRDLLSDAPACGTWPQLTHADGTQVQPDAERLDALWRTETPWQAWRDALVQRFTSLQFDCGGGLA